MAPRIVKLDGNPEAVDLEAVMGLLKERAETLNQLAEEAMLFCGPYIPADAELKQEHLTPEALTVLADFAGQAETLPEWTIPALSDLIKTVLKQHNLKMPKLGIPLRVAVTGRKQTPAVDAVLSLLGRETVLKRLAATLGNR